MLEARGIPGSASANVGIEALPGQPGWLKHGMSREAIDRLIPFPRMAR
jgi:hypothetical protein